LWNRAGTIVAGGIAAPALITFPSMFAANVFAAPEWVSQLFVLGFVFTIAIQFVASAITQWAVFPIIGCISLCRTFRHAGLEQRQQIRWPLYGILAAVTSYFLAVPAAIALTFTLRLPSDGLAHALIYYGANDMAIVCLLLIPIAFAFAILKYRLMEIDLYIRNTAIWGGITALLGLLYIGIAGGLGGIVGQFTGPSSQWVTAIATITVGAAFIPVRNRVQGIVDERFFRKRDYASALQSLARRMEDVREPSSLATTAAEHLQRAVQCRSVVLTLNQTGTMVPAARVGSGPTVEEVQIRYRDAVVGGIAVGSKLSDQLYDAQDRDFLSAAAVQVAVGLERLLLQNDRRELERAREIQEALLPSSIPRADAFDIEAAWQPAQSVGGDYYDVIALDSGRFALVVADVSGKGLPAALLMANLQAAVKAFIIHSDGPATLCRRVNRLLCANVGSGRYVTFFFGIIDAPNRLCTYCNAGHNPPILCQSSGAVMRLDVGGTVLGLFPDALFEERQVTLEPGDRLLLFTDGVSEAFSAEEEEFGDDRLIAILRQQDTTAAAVKESILSAVTTFCDGRFHDDATMIVVSVRAATRASA
jgi:sigma-B regulation protein RsbU (phosphoserine phosphatase)